MPGPIFQNITPAPSSSISPATPIQFDVIDTGSPISLVVPIIAVDPNVAGELVYDWTLGVFSPAYLQNSTIVTITNGYRFTMRRLNGWFAPPILRVWAVDNAGNIGVL